MRRAQWGRHWALALALLSGIAYGQGDPVNAELLGQWDGFSGTYADVWGDGDYGYIGHFGDHGVHIVDISDRANPVDVAEYLLTDVGASAQDVKVADGLMFVAVEGGTESAHVVDVRDPADPVHLVTIDIAGYRSIHNVFYDNGYLYIADSNTTRVGIVDLTTLDPDNPPPGPITTAKWIIQNVGTSFVHDMTVAHQRLYAAAWDSGLWIYDVSNVATEIPSFLGQTPDGGDNTHSCWPTDNGDYVVTGEERTGGGIKVYRITDGGESLSLELTDALALPVGEASSVHNQVIDGYRLYNSWYAAGLRVHDINLVTGELEFVASLDTGGSVWGVYPFLGPGRVLLSNMSQGLLVVRVGDLPVGDLNGDGMVDTEDFFMLLALWGPCLDPCPPACPGDLDENCVVDVVDFFLLLANWG
jgi:hypothetical protein